LLGAASTLFPFGPLALVLGLDQWLHLVSKAI
jgi:hypothetical protein